MNLVFFNHFGVGDLYESREFVKDWMKAAGVTEALYYCRYPAVFQDMPEILTSTNFNPDLGIRTAWKRDGDTLYVNTWVGCRNGETKPPGDYVLWPGVGCTVENIFRMHAQYRSEVGFGPLPRSVVEYIPTIDYTRVGDLSGVHRFIDDYRGKEMVLVCNGPTGSGHAANFNMREAVRMVPRKENVIYIFTDGESLDELDFFYTDGITQRQKGECDVLKISYLSRFCRLIIGRCSGAQMPCETLENWIDSTKTIISFTEHDNGATFVRNPPALGLKMRRFWSGATTPEEAAKVIQSLLP